MNRAAPTYKGDPPGLVEGAQELRRDEGRQARRAGVSRQSCPAPEGTLARPFWLEGWDAEDKARS